MRNARLFLAVNAVAAALLSGCTEPDEECRGSVNLEVSTGSISPSFRWTPSCALQSVVVSDAADRVVWLIEIPGDQNALKPPVVYGEVPRGAEERQEAIALQVGVPYTVLTYWIDRSEGGVVLRLAGERTFVP